MATVPIVVGRSPMRKEIFDEEIEEIKRTGPLFGQSVLILCGLISSILSLFLFLCCCGCYALCNMQRKRKKYIINNAATVQQQQRPDQVQQYDQGMSNQSLELQLMLMKRRQMEKMLREQHDYEINEILQGQQQQMLSGSIYAPSMGDSSGSLLSDPCAISMDQQSLYNQPNMLPDSMIIPPFISQEEDAMQQREEQGQRFRESLRQSSIRGREGGAIQSSAWPRGSNRYSLNEARSHAKENDSNGLLNRGRTTSVHPMRRRPYMCEEDNQNPDATSQPIPNIPEIPINPDLDPQLVGPTQPPDNVIRL